MGPGAGNLYSTPQEISSSRGRGFGREIRVRLDKVIPAIPEGPTTKYIKHERIQSERLTKFWGRPSTGRARPPARGLRFAPGGAIPTGHLPRALPPDDRRVPREPPDPNLKPEYSACTNWLSVTASFTAIPETCGEMLIAWPSV